MASQSRFAAMPRAARVSLIGACLFAVVLAAFGVSRAAASALSVNNVTGSRQVASGNLTVTNSLRDQFTVSSVVTLNGQVSDFNGGAGFVTNSGPTWATYTNGSSSNDWSNAAADYVTRPTGGGNNSVALVPWLTRESTVGITISSMSSANEVGVVMGADSTGTQGLSVSLYHDGSTYRFGFWLLTSGSASSSCGTQVNTGSSTGSSYVITMTYDPSAGSAASASVVKSGGGGGTYNATSTCGLGTANGQYAGLMSFTQGTARYDNFTAVL